MSKGKEAEPSQSSCPAYDELLEGYGTRHGEALLAVEAVQDGAAGLKKKKNLC